MTVTLESLRKSVGKKNSKSKVFAWLADLERAAGDLDNALSRVDGGLTLYPNDVAAMLVRAKILFAKNDFDGCVQQCDKILVKDPFNLAAQKIMGDAYDQLGNVAERNLCYRRYHDMDPLNTFWKEEYDVVIETAAAAAAVEAVAETDFTMPAEGDDSLNMNLEDSPAGLTAAVAEESTSVENEPLFQMDAAEAEQSIEKAFGEAFVDEDDEVNLPEKSSEEEGLSADDDPFAALAAMLPNGDAADDSAMEELSASLDSVMDDIAKGVSSTEEFPVDENISGNDVNSAIADIFGAEDDDDFGGAEPAAPASPFANLPNSIDEVAEPAASEEFSGSGLFEKSAEAPVAEDKPLSVDDAFGDIFGEDELPEEKPVAQDLPAAEEGGLFEKSADSSVFGSSFDDLSIDDPVAPAAEDSLEVVEPAVEDKPLSVDDAFGDIFGEDELPEEKPVAEDKPMSVDDAFGDIFGEDELPEEKPVEPALEDMPVKEPVAEVESASDPVIASAMDFVLDDAPAAEEAPAEEPPVAEAPAEDVSTKSETAFSVDNAFDSLFGEEDDLFVEDKPAAETVTEEPVAAAENSSLEDQVVLAEDDLELPVAEPKAESSDLVKEMGGAFASMFGDDDELDLPGVKADSGVEQESTGAAVEESFENFAAPVESANVQSDLDKSFDSLFGNDDDLSLTEDLPAAQPEAQVAAPVAELNPLEAEVSGAFKGLFEMDDDALAEGEPVPSNKGVDFLMSGDSDDEVSAGLINNPDAPLDRGAHDLDESLNTRTLAEIYFDQGLYGKALDIYADLAQKEPDNEEIAARFNEIEQIYRTKFGGNA